MVWFEGASHYRSEHYRDNLDIPHDWGSFPDFNNMGTGDPLIVNKERGGWRNAALRGLASGQARPVPMPNRNRLKAGDVMQTLLSTANGNDATAIIRALTSAFSVGSRYGAGIVGADRSLPKSVVRKVEQGARVMELAAAEDLSCTMSYRMFGRRAGFSYISFDGLGDDTIYRVSDKDIKLGGDRGVLCMDKGEPVLAASKKGVVVNAKAKEYIRQHDGGEELLEVMRRSRGVEDIVRHGSSEIERLFERDPSINIRKLEYVGASPYRDSLSSTGVIHYFVDRRTNAKISCSNLKFDDLVKSGSVRPGDSCAARKGANGIELTKAPVVRTKSPPRAESVAKGAVWSAWSEIMDIFKRATKKKQKQEPSNEIIVSGPVIKSDVVHPSRGRGR